MKNKNEEVESVKSTGVIFYLLGLLGFKKQRAQKRPVSLIFGLLVLIAFAVLPFYLNVNTSYIGYYLFIVFIYIMTSQAWNLVAGYAGQLSLAGNAFFGLGAYTTFIIWIHHYTHTSYYFDPVLMILAGLIPIGLAVIVGFPLLSRLRGDYFAFGTLGVSEILIVVAIEGGSFTGGAGGLQVNSSVYTSFRPYYWVGLGLALLTIGLVYFVTRSRIGLAFKSIRDDETAASSHGVPVLRYKILAFALSAFVTGIAGSLYSYYMFNITPGSVLSLNWIIYPILVVVLGGTGTILGPVIGAFFVAALFAYGSIYLKTTHPLLSGALIILVMIFMPNGLIGLKDRIFSRGKQT